ncbi:hypothetical protein AB1L42_20460 [Thalassoglobus sp. JC818]|uniref:hypothetical protein n=1 Tax=Thalassoglobus sp. JC818 TaxID=3232136 RepID=UPI00345AB80E
MLTGVFVDAGDINDIRRGIDLLRQWETALGGDESAMNSLRQVLALDSARLVRLAHRHFSTDRFNLHQLAEASGEKIRVLHGMTGSLGRACENRGVEVFERHGGQPLVLSVRQEVAGILDAQVTDTLPLQN